MADRFYYCDLGADKVAVTEGAADSAGKAVSVRITYTATGLTQGAALNALKQIAARIQEDTWPPA